MSLTLSWIGFNLFVALMLVLDLLVFRRRSRVVRFREALAWSALWILLAALFASIIYFWQGRAPALDFATGYVIELSLSVDNLFVFILIFTHFNVPDEFQHRVLFWGVVGALVLRAIFIFIGVGLIRHFAWISYIFGALLVFSGIKLFRRPEEIEFDLDSNLATRALRRVFPVTNAYRAGKFFVREDRLYATPLLIVLLVVELTDVLFATDSVPAILAITRDTFIVYTSNALAILGLRSMYFALSGSLRRFNYLHQGLAIILVFIGVKMLIERFYAMPTLWALVSVAAILFVSVIASVMRKATA